MPAADSGAEEQLNQMENRPPCVTRPNPSSWWLGFLKSTGGVTAPMGHSRQWVLGVLGRGGKGSNISCCLKYNLLHSILKIHGTKARLGFST